MGPARRHSRCRLSNIVRSQDLVSDGPQRKWCFNITCLFASVFGFLFAGEHGHRMLSRRVLKGQLRQITALSASSPR